MSEQYLSVALDDVIVGEPLPTTLYIFIDNRFITLRANGDWIDRNAYDRLEFKKVKNLFISGKDKQNFEEWSRSKRQGLEVTAQPISTSLSKAREEAQRRTLDIFQSNNPDKTIQKAISTSKLLVLEVMKVPYAIQNLSQLQTYSRGTVDHSVNVSVLSVYFAMQMGYTHHVILQTIGMGGLLHDIGKSRVPILDSDNKKQIAEKMKAHPMEGVIALENQSGVPKEVKMIIAQHHENYDGSGFPKGLRGGQIYDLARIVAIANAFDEAVGDAQGTLFERQKKAMAILEAKSAKCFDPSKLQKVLKILKLGL